MKKKMIIFKHFKFVFWTINYKIYSSGLMVIHFYWVSLLILFPTLIIKTYLLNYFFIIGLINPIKKKLSIKSTLF